MNTTHVQYFWILISILEKNMISAGCKFKGKGVPSRLFLSQGRRVFFSLGRVRTAKRYTLFRLPAHAFVTYNMSRWHAGLPFTWRCMRVF